MRADNDELDFPMMHLIVAQSSVSARKDFDDLGKLSRVVGAAAWSVVGATVCSGSGALRVPCHDARGNLAFDPTTGRGFGYSSENLLAHVDGGAWQGTLVHDPLMRLVDAGTAGRTRFVHDGHTIIAEYDAANAQVARYVHGPGIDEPLVALSPVAAAGATMVTTGLSMAVVGGTVALFGAGLRAVGGDTQNFMVRAATRF
jgi:hypothetical protein